MQPRALNMDLVSGLPGLHGLLIKGKGDAGIGPRPPIAGVELIVRCRTDKLHRLRGDHAQLICKGHLFFPAGDLCRHASGPQNSRDHRRIVTPAEGERIGFKQNLTKTCFPGNECPVSVLTAADQSRSGWGLRGDMPATASAMARIWSGVVPQQPPTTLTSPASANSAT